MIPFPDKKYKVIYADPPWPVQLISRRVRPLQKDMPYKLMTLNDIKNLPVKEIADSQCMLFIWTTHKWLPKTFEVIEAWGFKYNCTFTWDKGFGFTPFGFMWSTEFCLFAQRKGKWIDLKKLGIKTMIRSPPDEHSVKPHKMREIIEQVSPEPRIELFARQKIPNWDAWGNQVEDLPTLETYTF